MNFETIAGSVAPQNEMPIFDDTPLNLGDLVTNEHQAETLDFVPYSEYDARAVAFFDDMLADIDSRLVASSDSREAEELRTQRSSIAARRMIYEMHLSYVTDRSLSTSDGTLSEGGIQDSYHTMRERFWPDLIAQVTDLSDKAIVQSKAILYGDAFVAQELNGTDAGTVVDQIELAKDVHALSILLCGEIEAGYNLHANCSYLESLLLHVECGVTRDDVYDALKSLMYTKFTQGDIEGAEHVQAQIIQLFGDNFTTSSKVLTCLRDNITWGDIVKKGVLTSDGRIQYSSPRRKRKEFLEDGVLHIKNVRRKYRATIFTRAFGTYWDDVLNVTLDASGYEAWAKDNDDVFKNIDYSTQSHGQERFLEDRAPIRTLNSRKEWLSERKTKYASLIENVKTPKNDLLVLATEIAILHAQTGEDDPDSAALIEKMTAIEMTLTDIASSQSRNPQINDLISIATQGAETNRGIDALFQEAKSITSLTKRFNFMAQIVRLQALVDPDSRDGSFNSKLTALEELSEIIELSAGDRLVLPRTIRQKIIDSIISVVLVED